ncbi:MAG TPA: tail fiber protein [Cellvibrionaceae bacterium]
MIGEVSIFAGNFAPSGYAFCEGQVLPISQNQALFSIPGTQYGGDGKTTFTLPDLRKAEEPLKGARYIIAIEGNLPQRE